MSDIVLSKAVRSNLLNLQNTTALLSKTQERLSTGKKVNSALDNPTNFFTAASLNSRAADLGRLLDSVSNAVQTIEAADNGISAITKLVETAQSTARQALQISGTVEQTTPATAGTVTAGAFTTVDVSGGSDEISFDLAVDGGPATTITIDSAAVTAYNSAHSTSFSASALTAENVAAMINDQAGATVASVAGGALSFTSTTTGASSSVDISGYSATVTGGSTGIANASNTGVASTTTSTPNPKRDEFVAQFNELRTQIDQLARDAGFNGVNLLNGDDLSVLFNEDGSSSLNIGGVTFNSAGLGINAVAAGGFDSNDAINATLDELKGAVDTLRTQASTFGSNLSIVETRQDFTKNLINTLETGASNLVLADTNEEAANLLALQTRQQLSSTALSLASQADQNVLRLF